MSTCNYTSQINEEQCLTDSLDVINNNVSTLDAALVAISAASLNANTEGISRVLQGHNISVLPLANNGTGYLTIGETVCPPWHIDQTDRYVYSGNTTDFILASQTPVAKVELNVYNGYPKFFTNNLNQITTLPAGWYRAVYKTGAMSYWSSLPRWYSITGETVLVAFPASTVVQANPWPGGGDYWTDNVNRALASLGTGTFRHDADAIQYFATAEAAIQHGLNYRGNGSPFYKNFYHPGGYLSVSFGDTPYTDNRVTTPSITYDLYPLTVVTLEKTIKQVSDNSIFLKHLADVVTENPPLPGGESLRDAGGTYPTGNNTYTGGVLLQDGRVFIVPDYQTTARIYDPKTDTLTTPAGTYPGNAAFIGGTLLPNGEVFMSPHYGTNRGHIYDPKTNTLKTTDPLFSGPLPFYQTAGSVLLKDGRVFGVPFFNAPNGQTYIYNPTTNTFVYTAATFPGGRAFSSGLLLPNGKVFLVPNGANPAYIYDPIADQATPLAIWPEPFIGTLTTTTQVTENVTVDEGGFIFNTRQSPWVITPSGIYNGSNYTKTYRIAWYVGDPNYAHIPVGSYALSVTLGPGGYVDYWNFIGGWAYNNIGYAGIAISGSVTSTGTTTTTTSVTDYTTTQGYSGAVLLPNGEVYVIPGRSGFARIYNPFTETLRTAGGVYPQEANLNKPSLFAGGVLMPDGRVLAIPNGSSTARIYDYRTDTLTAPSITFGAGGVNSFIDGVLLQNGDIYVVPWNTTKAKIFGYYHNRNFDNAALTGPFLNNI